MIDQDRAIAGPIYHREAIDGLHELQGANAALAVLDLPFGTTQAGWDKPLDLEALWPALLSAMAPNGVVAAFAAGRFVFELYNSRPDSWRYDLIWSKNKSTGHLNASSRPLRAHESILIFYDLPPTYTPQKVRRAPRSAHRRGSSGEHYGDCRSLHYAGGAERHPASVLEFDVVNNDSPHRIHSSQKPLALIRWLIESYTQPGDLVIDPTSGSGTTACASHDTGRRCVCLEKRLQFVESSQQRYAEHIAQQRLPLFS